MILLYGSSLISESPSWWSFISSVGLLHFILGLTSPSVYVWQNIALLYSTHKKHCNKSFKTVTLDFTIKYLRTEYFSLFLSGDWIHFAGIFFTFPIQFFADSHLQERIYDFVPCSPLLGWHKLPRSDCLSCFLLVFLCLRHRNILPSLSVRRWTHPRSSSSAWVFMCATNNN